MALINQEGMQKKGKRISDIVPRPEIGSDQGPERSKCQRKPGERIAVRNDAISCYDGYSVGGR